MLTFLTPRERADRWRAADILPTEKQNVSSAPEHGRATASCEKAVWSDIHEDVIGDSRGSLFNFLPLSPFYSVQLLCFPQIPGQELEGSFGLQREGPCPPPGLLTCPSLCSE